MTSDCTVIAGVNLFLYLILAVYDFISVFLPIDGCIM